jgi:copper chaperone CopZ
MATTRIMLVIEGLDWEGRGALPIERALTQVPGVGRAYVNPDTEMAYVEYDPGESTPAQLIAAVAQVGFRAGTLPPHPEPRSTPIPAAAPLPSSGAACGDPGPGASALGRSGVRARH